VARLDEQADALAAREPDVVCLQEVTRTTAERWCARLGEMGLADAACVLPEKPRRLAVLLAGRELAEAAQPAVPRPESARAAFAGGLLVVGAHVPNAANGWVKVETLEALAAHLGAAGPGPRLLCGDLNTPRREHADGTVWTFARDGRGKLREERGQPWEAGERAPWRVLDDAFRRLHPPGDGEVSWTWRRWKGGYRLDHVLVSPEVEVSDCRYHHDWRESGLSDHSAMEVDVRAPQLNARA
jgi:endonuclease/exonuclease/phosphatase family metal-dependent hydrolase